MKQRQGQLTSQTLGETSKWLHHRRKRRLNKRKELKKRKAEEEKKRALAAMTKKPAPATKKKAMASGKAKRKLTPVQTAASASKGKKVTSPATKKKTTKRAPQKKLTYAAEMAGMKNNHVRLAQWKALWDAETQQILEAERCLEESKSESNEQQQPKDEPLDPAIQELIHETEKHHLSDDCRKNHRHRIRRMTEFWKQSDKAPDGCVERAVRKVPRDEHNNKSNWFHANEPRVGPFKEDLHCDETSADCCKQFLREIMIKKDRDYRSADDVGKFRDAIMWGAKTAKQFTPPTFCGDIEIFHKAHRKKHANARKRGNAQDTAADPVTSALCKKLLEWSLDENNVCAWHWTQQQWNLMAWLANVDPVKLHNFRLGINLMTVKFDESKADKQAQRLAPKNVYAHPFDFRLCHFTGLGIHIALRKDKMKGTKSPFLSKNAKEGSASEMCVEQLQSIVDRHKHEMETHMSLTRFNPHGLWKGAATHATSGTAMAPSVPAIACRGEWSLSGALDCCWHFGNKGDQCSGRVLTGLDATGPDFDCLSPHFNLDNPMANSHMARAMKITCGEEFLDEHADFTQILLRCLASIVHHKKSLMARMHGVRGHDFNGVAILHHPALLKELKTLVTIKPSTVIAGPTGIPPHVETNRNLFIIIAKLSVVLELQKGQDSMIAKTMTKALEDRAVAAGQPAMAAIESPLDQKVAVMQRIQEAGLKAIANTHNLSISDGGDAGDLGFGNDGTDGDGTDGNNPVQNKWVIKGAFWFVPPDFKFPSCKLEQGLVHWFKGMELENGVI